MVMVSATSVQWLDVAAVLAAHRQIVPGGGALRSVPVRSGPGGWIRPEHGRVRRPPAEQVPRLLDDLVALLNRTDLCPVAHTAIGHAQLQLVHPFRDGSGRVGRWLLQVLPRRRGAAERIYPPMGLYFVANKEPFAAAHRAYRDGDLRAWCEFFGDAVVKCAAAAEQVLTDRSALSAPARQSQPSRQSKRSNL